MGYLTLKPDLDKDEYVIWTTESDEPFAVGTRDEVQDWFTERHVNEVIKPMLEVVDKHGDSRERFKPADPDGKRLVQSAGDFYWVRHADTSALAHLLFNGLDVTDPRVAALLTPMKDNE